MIKKHPFIKKINKIIKLNKKFYLNLGKKFVSGITLTNLIMAQVLMIGLFVFPIKSVLANDTGLNSPTTNINNKVKEPENAYSSNNLYAQFNGNNKDVQYGSFNIPSIPADNSIDGIELFFEGYIDGGENLIISLSKDGGVSYGATTYTTAFTGTESIISVGGSTDLWGQTWTAINFSNANFKVKVAISSGSNKAFLDHLQTKVYYSEPPTTLTITKVVTNDNGGTKVVADFPLFIDGNQVTSGVQNTVTAGTHQVSETNQSGYTATFGGDCDSQGNVTLSTGQSKFCTITNDDIQPKLTVTKVVVNDNGGTKVVADFPLFVGDTPVTSDVENGFNAGTYTVSETQQEGYIGTITGDCGENGSISLLVGDVKSCTITNDDIAPTLTLVKEVNGDAYSEEWELFADGPTSISGFGGASSDETFEVGTYTLFETGPGGYTPSGWSCAGGIQNGNQITLDVGESATCSITNTFVPPGTIVIVKETVGGDGSFDFESDELDSFNIMMSGGFGSKLFSGLEPDTYSVSETGLSDDWILSSATCISSFDDEETPDSIELDADEVIICTFTNTYTKGTLIVKKILPNNNGSTANPEDFSFSVNGDEPIQFEEDGVNELIVTVGTYTVTEPVVEGFSTSYENCAEVEVGPGKTAICTITNDDQPGTLIIKKIVTNDNNGTKTVSDFSFSVNEGELITFEEDGQNDITVDAGTYTVTESEVSGYATTYDNCADIVIPNGGSATCTITNDDIAPSLTLVKEVNNEEGGQATASDWTLTATGPSTLTGTTPVTSGSDFQAGTYTLSESTGPENYVAGGSWNCQGVQNDGSTIIMGAGDSATCTIINTYRLSPPQPKLTVTKVVTNDNGGTKVIADFPLFVGQTSVISGEQTEFEAGTYTISETGNYGYSATFSGDCAADGSITLNVGDVKSCTITNDDIQPKLTVTKVVTNDNGGTKVVADFPLFIDQTSVTSGVENGFNAGTYTVSETQQTGYTSAITGDCGTNGSITLNVGDVKSCTITNDDIAPTPAPTGGGGGGGPIIFAISEESVHSTVNELTITINWSTNDFSTSQVIYGAEDESHTLDLNDNTGVPPKYGYANTTIESDTAPKVTYHTVVLTGLDPNKTYYYRAVSRGSFDVSNEYSFTTSSTFIQMIAQIPGGEITPPPTPTEQPGLQETVPGETPITPGETTTETPSVVSTPNPTPTAPTATNPNLFTAGAGLLSVFNRITGSKLLMALIIIIIVVIVVYLVVFAIRRKKK